MNCPACQNHLTQKKVQNLTVDVCENGCGGIWFDLFELKKVDEKHEAAGEELLNIKRTPGFKPDYSKRLKCPVCTDMTMLRHFFSVKHEVEVDECPNCGGFWLDHGELGQIRSQFKDEEERKKAARQYLQEACGPALKKLRDESEMEMIKGQKIARMFRFLCPSYYIPGDQEWGAF